MFFFFFIFFAWDLKEWKRTILLFQFTNAQLIQVLSVYSELFVQGSFPAALLHEQNFGGGTVESCGCQVIFNKIHTDSGPWHSLCTRLYKHHIMKGSKLSYLWDGSRGSNSAKSTACINGVCQQGGTTRSSRDVVSTWFVCELQLGNLKQLATVSSWLKEQERNRKMFWRQCMIQKPLTLMNRSRNHLPRNRDG